MTVNEQREHRELSEAAIKARIREMEEGDEVLFDERKRPLTVIEETDHGVYVEGPRGGEYYLSSYDGKISFKFLSDDTEGIRRGGKRNLEYVEISEKSSNN